MSSFKRRLAHLHAKLREWKCDGALLEDPVDLFYLTGLKVSAGSLLVDGQRALLLVDGRYLELAEKESSVPAALADATKIRTFFRKKKRVVFDSQKTTYERYLKLVRQIPLLHPVAGVLKEIRAIKDAEEQRSMKKSAKLLIKGFHYLQTQIRAGITEKELAFAFEIYCRQKGAEGLAFESIIAFGENSAMPHHRSGERKLKKGDIILIDIGLIVDGYRSDMTRVLFFGKASPTLKKLEKIVGRAKAAALALCKPGTFTGDLDRAAKAVMAKEKVEHLFVHSLGHGIGLETHEFPKIRAASEDEDVLLEPGMAITIEPGLYMPGVGGIRSEDLVIITNKGYKNLYEPTL